MRKYSRWEDVPDHLVSKTALGRIGLKPNGDPVAQVFQRLGTTWINLYDKNTALPKRSVSDRAAALRRARGVYEKKVSVPVVQSVFSNPSQKGILRLLPANVGNH